MRKSLPASVLCVLLAGCAAPVATPTPVATVAPTAEPSTVAPTPTVTWSPTPGPVTYPRRGPGTYAIATGTGPVAGASGTLLRYQVAVEHEITGFDLPAATAFVEATLSDPRGWTGGGLWRLQRVGPEQPADFTVYFVTPGTRDEVCPGWGDGYTNCRNGARVVVNIDRWQNGTPHIDASHLEEYRRYIVNHETGHRLGYNHELCPGPGQPAPVMQQQTLGLHGCTLNAWPYVGGVLHRGASGAYDDPIPAPAN